MRNDQWVHISKKLLQAIDSSRDRLEQLHPEMTIKIALEQRDIRTYRWFMKLPSEVAEELQSELDAE